MIVRIVAIAVFVWLIGVCVHFLWEAWIIGSRGFEALPECFHWWCPHGFLNRMRKQ